MGKKRRLKSSKAKFAAKHSNHPRMVLLRAQAEETETEAEAPSLTPVIEATVEVLPEVPTPTVEEKVVTKPKTTRKKKTTKKTTTRRSKSKTKKKVNQDATT